jgi:hypothetical protein
MARGEVWNLDVTLFRIAGFHIAQARLFVAQDDAVPILANAYRMLCSLRILGTQIDNDAATNNFAVKDGPIAVPVSVSTFSGSVAGKISGFQGTTKTGAASADTNWKDAEHVEFTLAAVGNVSIPVSDILALVPGIGFVLRAVLTALPGGKVNFNLGQTDIHIPVLRDTSGKPILPPKAVVPTWWQ